MRNIQNTVITGLVSILFAVGALAAPSLAQDATRDTKGGIRADTSHQPHDFNDDAYKTFGVDPGSIVSRRAGTDGWSVFSPSSNRRHSDVRVTATLPAYDDEGRHLYWYPLGDLYEYGFTQDDAGNKLTERAQMFRMYIFPDRNSFPSFNIGNARQAALIDNSWQRTGRTDLDPNPAGVRQLYMVNYTDKAFRPDAERYMKALAEKNGLATDKTPIIRTIREIKTLLSLGYVTFSSGMRLFEQDLYRIGPMISDPSNGTIARDAFLIMPLADGRPLAAEGEFVKQFECYQSTGNECRREKP